MNLSRGGNEILFMDLPDKHGDLGRHVLSRRFGDVYVEMGKHFFGIVDREIVLDPDLFQLGEEFQFVQWLVLVCAGYWSGFEFGELLVEYGCWVCNVLASPLMPNIFFI